MTYSERIPMSGGMDGVSHDASPPMPPDLEADALIDLYIALAEARVYLTILDRLCEVKP